MDWLEFQQMSDCTQYETMVECPHCGTNLSIWLTPGVQDSFSCGHCGDNFVCLGE